MRVLFGTMCVGCLIFSMFLDDHARLMYLVYASIMMQIYIFYRSNP